MKKTILITITFLSLVNCVKAQLNVYSDGKVGVAISGTTTPESTFSVNEGMTGFEGSIKGTKRGLFSAANGQYMGWSYGVYGRSNCKTANFQNGIIGSAEISSPQTSYRTYGVIGLASNATNGWNYGVFGQLNGTNNGAGVYGTATHDENGTYVDGRYAGYFNGLTKVNGNLTVTGSITGVILNSIPNSSDVSVISDRLESSSLIEKLSNLTMTQYYTSSTSFESHANENRTDTISNCPTLTEFQILSSERKHYGFDLEKMRENFPELVYEQEDGHVGINYMEIIPILIHAINNLKTEVQQLRATNAYLSSDKSSVKSNVIILGTDGKVIGNK